jgi:hypothetical protein
MSWLVPAALGAYHGLNPAMGWLFAVAIGLQDRRAIAVLRALPPIALGHAAAVGVVVAVFASASTVVPAGVLRACAAAILFAFAAFLVFGKRLHPRWVGMRVGGRELVIWSFLMSSAHGAGLMLIPLIAHSHGHAAHSGSVAVLGVHTIAMFASMTVAAVCVYHVAGVGFLRRAWLNLELVWAAALIIAGITTLRLW